MQKLRAIEVLQVFQRRNERLQVMAIDGADVVEAEFFKQRGWHHHTFGMLLKAFGQLKKRRCGLEHLLGTLFGGGVKASAHQLGQVAVERPHRRTDRHVVVVEDHQELAVFHPRMVEGLESHARGHRAITDHGNRMSVFALLARSQSHAQRG